jgi:hypothetical protein
MCGTSKAQQAKRKPVLDKLYQKSPGAQMDAAQSAALQQQDDQFKAQMELSVKQQQIQQAQYEEQRRIAMAPPPPGPNESATMVAPALTVSPLGIRAGVGRRALRTSGLSIAP